MYTTVSRHIQQLMIHTWLINHQGRTKKHECVQQITEHHEISAWIDYLHFTQLLLSALLTVTVSCETWLYSRRCSGRNGCWAWAKKGPPAASVASDVSVRAADMLELDMPHSPGCFIVGEPERATEALQARRDEGEMEIKAASGNRGRVWQRVRVDILYLNVWPRMLLWVNISISHGEKDKRMNKRPSQVPCMGWHNKNNESLNLEEPVKVLPKPNRVASWFTVVVFRTVFHH